MIEPIQHPALMGLMAIDTMQIINGLRDSPFKFHLTGSRYFQTTKPLSDWDFFTQQSDEVRNFLGSQGFHKLDIKTDYSGRYGNFHNPYNPNNPLNIAEVWGAQNFHFQLVSDYELKKAIHVQLSKKYEIVTWGRLLRAWNKSARRDFWNLLMNVAQVARECKTEVIIPGETVVKEVSEPIVVTEAQKDEALENLPHSGVDDSMKDFVSDLVE